jgi:hypothetical protein
VDGLDTALLFVSWNYECMVLDPRDDAWMARLGVRGRALYSAMRASCFGSIVLTSITCPASITIILTMFGKVALVSALVSAVSAGSSLYDCPHLPDLT